MTLEPSLTSNSRWQCCHPVTGAELQVPGFVWGLLAISSCPSPVLNIYSYTLPPAIPILSFSSVFPPDSFPQSLFFKMEYHRDTAREETAQGSLSVQA